MRRFLAVFTLVLAIAAVPARAEPPTLPGGYIDYTGMVIYEVNLRQYTPEGTIDAFRAGHLDRLEEMGVDILWLMPIHPIGQEQRKGTLGSYYAATDYKAVNPEFGTLEDLKALVGDAHGRGMLVILDWAPNHTAWDHVWTESNPEWYTEGPGGGFVPPNPDWSDVIDLNYDNADMREAMTGAMKFWLTEAGIDGFRCDVAELVPDDYWTECIAELRATKPVFMLAEGQAPRLFDCGFDVCYGWGLADNTLRVISGEATVDDLWAFIENDRAELGEHGEQLPLGPQRMWFTTNHDWNSWVGLATERFGPALPSATLLTFAVPGVPMIYSGQEANRQAGLDKQLAFFEKDEIDWGRGDQPSGLGSTYAWLCEAIAGDPRRLRFDRVESDGLPETVFCFERNVTQGRVMMAVNLSAEPAEVAVNGWTTTIAPWGYDYRMIAQAGAD